MLNQRTFKRTYKISTVKNLHATFQWCVLVSFNTKIVHQYMKSMTEFTKRECLPYFFLLCRISKIGGSFSWLRVIFLFIFLAKGHECFCIIKYWNYYCTFVVFTFLTLYLQLILGYNCKLIINIFYNYCKGQVEERPYRPNPTERVK